MIGTLSVVTGLFGQIMPLILPQTPQKRCDLWKRVVLRCPLNMLRKAHHLEHRCAGIQSPTPRYTTSGVAASLRAAVVFADGTRVKEIRGDSNLDQGIGTAGRLLNRERHVVNRRAAGRMTLVAAVMGMTVDDSHLP
jgi:hypothetical protein